MRVVCRGSGENQRRTTKEAAARREGAEFL